MTFATERRGDHTMSPDDLLNEWLNQRGPESTVEHRLVSVQEVESSSRFDTPNSIQQTSTYLVAFD